jgi:hypothetical protein
MSQSRSWRVASHELAEFVQEAGPRIALAGAVACLIFVVPMTLRFWAFFPG